ncbi:hypothetical protein B0T18DRAFT_425049 [Schizothecium vesticola]|uniref:J domain-containing protein n=1 Tax=Schizothecium vesticola TaxID=314040 RepID=A0AA40FBF2_9PEZI|nr:hypothetical protein B0T18DRAFT_425049 [Schizothecium vesticola]
MPLRCPPTGVASALGVLLRRPSPFFSHHHQPFHTTPRLRRDDPPSDDQTHYDTLQIPPDAPLSDIKKSFFALSKRHHPDHNPTDPHAPRRFMRLSEAYAVLGHADKRARYDRDVMRHLHPTPVPHRHGSYHSTTSPAGGRPASGLSRRRATFHGPPPSFYRSGGWGAHGAKRKAAHDESTGGAEAGGAWAGTASEGGMGPGQNPWRARNDHDRDVPHWDREAHERTQRRHDERRARRMASRVRFQGGENPFVGFFIVSGVLAAGLLGPYILIGMWMADGKGKDKKADRL